ncbi:MAG TPA: PQQ-binding-like beta-propeller repeat protein, partial [Pirellulaceae bacterium]|nr:PQQ-binding-like beta-propeller repeat protein [Pirellulaceae bacterium]
GQWIGTPAYMCPEQALGQAHRVGTAGDVYSLGATLYMLLTGRAPIVGANVAQTLKRVIAGELPRPREVNRLIPRPLEAICQKAMALRPEDRYASPNDLADELERWLADEPVTAARDNLVAKLARWGRRNRTRVVAATIALIVVTVISLAAAILINGERLRADRERIEADRRNARLAFDRGYVLTQDQEHGAGLLWYARALAHAPREDAPLRRVILTNMNAARHHLLRRGEIFAHTANLKTAAISADGRWLATADYEDQARLWDIASGAMLTECKLTRRPMTAHIGEDGTAVFAAATGKAISLERLPAAATEAGLPATIANTGDVNCAAFSADGSMLATGGSGRETHARLWRISDGQQLAEFPHPRSVEQVVFWPGHDGLATVSSDGQMRLWKFDGDRPDWGLKLQAGLVAHVAFTRDGKQIIVGDTQGHLSCFDVDARRWLFELGRESGQVTAVACAADSQTVAAAWTSGIARTWNLADRRQLLELLRIDRHTQLVLFRPRTQQMLVASEPRAAVLWDIPDASQVGLPLGQGFMSAVAVSPDQKTVITGSTNGTVVLRDAVTGKTRRQLTSHQKSVRVVAFRPDGAVVLTASHDGTARLFDVATGKPQGDLMDHRPGHPDVQVETAAFSKDGRYVLTGDNGGRIHIWDGNTGESVRPLAKHDGAVRSLCFSPGGEQVAAGYSTPDKGVRLWDLASGKLLWTARHGNTVRSVAFSPNGSLVLSASNDVTARLWNAADGKQVGPNLTHRGEVFIAAFSPNGTLAMTGSYDATVRLWEVPSGRPVGEPMRHEGMVTSADFRTSKLLLTGGSVDRSARLWDVTTCLPLSPPLVHNSEVAAVGLHPAGKIAYTGRLWHLPQPLPDEPALVDLWVKLATQRKFTAGDTIEWLRPAEVAAAAEKFHDRTGKSWDQWAE